MNNTSWFILVGSLMLVMGLAAPLIRKIPVTPAMIYLAVGVVCGPTGLVLYHFNPLKESALLEILTEVVILISLFSAGIKMPVPFSLARWRTPILLAFVSMSVGVGLVATYGVYVLGLPLGAAIILGAVLAPTDPVLATDVQIAHPGQRDRLRFKLTAEAGMNDGSAFPFVMLGLGVMGLHDLGNQGMRWFLVDVCWATGAAITVGILCGYAAARIVALISSRSPREPGILDDFIGLGLIAVVYGISLQIDAWGFLAVFFAALSLRQTELALPGYQNFNGSSAPEVSAGNRPTSTDSSEAFPQRHQVSRASLIFKEHLERLSEVVLVLMLGGALFIDSWSLRAILLALFLFFVVRPASVMMGLSSTRCPRRIRLLLAWFGVRGIGSLYYLMYVIQHGLPEDLALELIHLTLVVVVMSIVIHGITVKPLLKHVYQRHHRLSDGTSQSGVQNRMTAELPWNGDTGQVSAPPI